MPAPPPHAAARRPAPRPAAAPRCAAVRVLAHGAVGATELKKQGFIGEMRAVAMKLHTRDQAPKEGGQAASPKPMPTVRAHGRAWSRMRAHAACMRPHARTRGPPEPRRAAAARGAGRRARCMSSRGSHARRGRGLTGSERTILTRQRARGRRAASAAAVRTLTRAAPGAHAPSLPPPCPRRAPTPAGRRPGVAPPIWSNPAGLAPPRSGSRRARGTCASWRRAARCTPRLRRSWPRRSTQSVSGRAGCPRR